MQIDSLLCGGRHPWHHPHRRPLHRPAALLLLYELLLGILFLAGLRVPGGRVGAVIVNVIAAKAKGRHQPLRE